jgi:hypothetical protein
MRVRGSLFLFHLFDICEEIRMDELALRLGTQVARPDPHMRQTARVWFESPPAVESIGEIDLTGQERFRAELHYYSYGVVSLRLERSFDLEWRRLQELCERWISAPAAEAAAAEQVQRHVAAINSALVKPYHPHLSEDYTIIRIDPIVENGLTLTADQLLERCGNEIAQIVRGDVVSLAPEEQTHVLASRLSYYPSDLIVAGWSAACVYDSASGAEPTIRLIEYANTQLLEFRFYDELLTRTLGEVYRLLDEGTGFWRRWRLTTEAERLNTIRLDVYELTERSENAAKFLSDMFAARLYRLVAERVGVPDYRRLVLDKLQTAGELYRFMTERIHQSSALILESMVVAILIIDLIFLFRGNT